MRSHQFAAALAVAAALALAACSRTEGSKSKEELEGAVKARELPRVRVEPVLEREMTRLLETTTKVESEVQHEVVPRASGLVTEVLVEEGDRVAAGQVLARLDDREAKIAVREAEVTLAVAKDDLPKLELTVKEAESRADSARRSAEQAQRDLERNEVIAQTGAQRPGLLSAKDLEASRLQRDQAQSDYDTAKLSLERARVDRASAKNAVNRAELQLEQARLFLSYMEILAPSKGVIATRALHIGDSVAATTTFSARAGVAGFQLTDVENLRVVFFRPQRELALFNYAAMHNGERGPQPELELTAHAEALPDKLFRGTIERVAPTIDPQSGAFRVTARMQVAAENDPGAKLLPGMLVRLAIVTERRAGARVVQKRSLVREGEVNYVFAVRDGRARRVTVDEGLSDDQYVEVLPREGGELAVGDMVVVVGNRDLEDGSEVQVEAAPSAPIAAPATQAAAGN